MCTLRVLYLRLCLRSVLRTGVVLAIALALNLVGTPNAYAKKVSLQWKPIRLAQEYQIEFMRHGKVFLKKSISESTWSGDLAPGFYAYRIRAVDPVKRPGKWSSLLPLAVMPPSSELEAPLDGQVISLYDPRSQVTLKWKPGKGVAQYRIELKQGNQLVHSESTSETSIKLRPLPSGSYTWQVIAVLEPSRADPEIFKGKQWLGKPSESGDFKLVSKRLDSVQLKSPLGVREPPSDGQIQFKWSAVDGAQAYEVELNGARKRITKETSAVFAVPGEGKRSWKVRALASIDEKGVPQAQGPISIGEFKLDKSVGYNEGRGSIANYLAKVNLTTGALDTAFTTAAGLNNSVNALAATGSAIYAGGNFTTYRGTPVQNLIKVDSTNGILDGAFSGPSGPSGTVTALLVSGASLYLGGQFYTYRGVRNFYLCSRFIQSDFRNPGHQSDEA